MALISRRVVRHRLIVAGSAVALAALVAGCGTSGPAGRGDRLRVVVTFPVLGAVVTELVDGQADVGVLMPDNVDPHDWSPSARDVEAVGTADAVIANGLGLEEGLTDALDEADHDGTPIFRATDHITVRSLGTSSTDPGDEHDGGDPHFWTDPIAMRDVVVALGRFLGSETGLDVSARAETLATRLDDLDASVRERVATIPRARRKLVTGHESLGYFADRYGFQVVGTVIPASTSQAEASARQIARLAERVHDEHVDVIFTEIGTSKAVVDAISTESGARVVEVATHSLPDDGSYFTFLDDLVDRIVAALRH